jgi:hypothetical protein
VFRSGTPWDERKDNGKVMSRKVRTLQDARVAHRSHFTERTRSR